MQRATNVVVALLATLALAGCSGGAGDATAPPAPPAATGPLSFGIVSGQNQIVTAGDTALGAPVVGQLVRLPNGQYSFRQRSTRAINDAAVAALDLFVPRAFAQGTTVKGSPVPGAVVCAQNLDPVLRLTSWVPCTNTDAMGNATFFFTTTTRAGTAMAEIRGTFNNLPAVFDTARATVVPGSAWGQQLLTDELAPTTGDTIDLRHVIINVMDRYGNIVIPGGRGGLPDTLTTWTPTYSVDRNFGMIETPVIPKTTGWKFVADTLPMPAGYTGPRYTLLHIVLYNADGSPEQQIVAPVYSCTPNICQWMWP